MITNLKFTSSRQAIALAAALLSVSGVLTAAESAAPPEPPKPQPVTVLIFRDGRKIEVQNYAISGATLYNLSDSGPHQVALEDLDLTATTKANNDRGISFRLPKKS